MEPIEFTEYEKMFSEGKYLKAFNILESIINNSSYSNHFKSEAYNLQGVCISFDPAIDINNESGLFYFKQAILLNKNNIEAHLNVINSFGTSPNNHQDIESFMISVQYLKMIDYKFDKVEFNKVKLVK